MSELDINFDAFNPEMLDQIAAESAAEATGEVEKLDADGNPIAPDLDKPKPKGGLDDGEKSDLKPDPDQNDGVDDGDTEGDVEEDEAVKNTKLVYSNIAKLLNEEGLFSNEDLKLDDISSSDKLVEAMKAEIKRNEFADLSETQRKYLTAVRDGVPADIFLQHEQVMQSYQKVSEAMIAEDEDLRKEIILRDLTNKGVDERRATKLYKSLVDAGEDVEEAVASLSNLKASEQAIYKAEVDKIAADKAAEEKQNKKRFDTLKNSVFETKEIIKNYKITDKLRDEVFANMTKPVSYSEEGLPINKLTSEREKDPIGFDTKLYYLFTMTKGFKDFSTFEKKAQSKAARQLERVVQESSNLLNIGSKPNDSGDDAADQPHFVELSD